MSVANTSLIETYTVTPRHSSLDLYPDKIVMNVNDAAAMILDRRGEISRYPMVDLAAGAGSTVPFVGYTFGAHLTRIGHLRVLNVVGIADYAATNGSAFKIQNFLDASDLPNMDYSELVSVYMGGLPYAGILAISKEGVLTVNVIKTYGAAAENWPVSATVNNSIDGFGLVYYVPDLY